MKALVSIITLAVLATLPLAAQTDPHFFSIDFPEDGDTFNAYDGLKTEAYREDAGDLTFEFEGRIGSAGKSIRVVWAGGEGGKDDYTLGKYKAGEPTFVYRASKPLSNLGFGSNYYRFIATFKDGVKVEKTLTIYVLHGHMGERAKPVIYLYPTKEQPVFVNVRPRGGVTTSIPEIGAGWNVKASPSGVITGADGQSYHYLFWESHETSAPEPLIEGFVVPKDQVTGFFQQKLAVLGLNAAETKDFLDYWTPYLTKSPYVQVYFHPKERIDADAPLDIRPAPDSVIRVYFEFRPVNEPTALKLQILVPTTRQGFAVVEWGGRKP